MRFFIYLISTIFCSSLFAFDKPYAPESVTGTTIVSAEDVVNMILSNPKMIVIDSRKRTEYVKGHIEGAVNILNTEMKLEDLKSIAPEKQTVLLFYCNGIRCLRSSDAANKAIQWGYTHVYWFRGGWKEWSDKKLPVVTE